MYMFHVQGSVRNSLRLKTSQFLHGQHTHMSLMKHVWDVLDWRIRQRVLIPVNTVSNNFAQPLRRSGPTLHRRQTTTWPTLRRGCIPLREGNYAHTRHRFCDPPNPTINYLSQQHLEMPHQVSREGSFWQRRNAHQNRFGQICEQYLGKWPFLYVDCFLILESTLRKMENTKVLRLCFCLVYKSNSTKIRRGWIKQTLLFSSF